MASRVNCLCEHVWGKDWPEHVGSIEVGKNAALLAVGVDWIVFPQARYPSLDVVFEEVDLFLAGTGPREAAQKG